MNAILQSAHDGIIQVGVNIVRQLAGKPKAELLDLLHALDERVTTAKPQELLAMQVVASAVKVELESRR